MRKDDMLKSKHEDLCKVQSAEGSEPQPSRPAPFASTSQAPHSSPRLLSILVIDLLSAPLTAENTQYLTFLNVFHSVPSGTLTILIKADVVTGNDDGPCGSVDGACEIQDLARRFVDALSLNLLLGRVLSSRGHNRNGGRIGQSVDSSEVLKTKNRAGAIGNTKVEILRWKEVEGSARSNPNPKTTE